LFEGDIPLQFPKPVDLLKTLIELGTDVDSGHLVLDFFAGAGTTQQAVFELNRADGGDRRAILVQLPEAISGGRYSTVAAVAIERIRRVIKKLLKEAKPGPHEDLGVRVLKLAASNFRAWQGYTGDDMSQLEIRFAEAEDPLTKGWTPDGLLTEVMLVEGFPLESSVADLGSTGHNSVKVVTSEHCSHRLLVCLDKRIEDSVVEKLSFEAGDVLVCRDTALTDQTKQRLADHINLKTI
jgi:adenine-specific DNA-methyltransferase